MQVLYSDRPGFAEAMDRLCSRPAYPAAVEQAAAKIIQAVRERGDAAISEFAAEFDHVKLTPAEFRVRPEEIEQAAAMLPVASRKAIRTALKQIRAFSKQSIPQAWSFVPRPGVRLGERFEPLSRVGVYIPGGTAPLVSTVIHTAGIASAAGVKEIVAVTPARKDGTVHPAVLYAMREAGVTEIYRLGGVYGVAAMACGTATVRKVEKIVGPGNAYVTAAKKLLYGQVALDMVAGPSEILILADATANPEFVAADMLSQAEHGSGLEQAVLMTDDPTLPSRVQAEIERQKALLPRLATVDKVLNNGCFMIVTGTLAEAAELAGRYAPEHLELCCRNARALAKKIKAAGAIFIGHWTPEPIGDFCAGPSHVLPTAGSARFFTGLTVSGFFRRMSTVEYTPKALRLEIPIAEEFAAMEGLAAHGRSASCRRSRPKES